MSAWLSTVSSLVDPAIGLLLLCSPLLLAACVMVSPALYRRLRPVLPLAALPALVLLALPPMRWLLHPVLLGSQLVLDGAARWQLGALSLCWLLAGALLRPLLARQRGAALCFLVATACTQIAVLAAESLLLFAASTAGGYALLGLALGVGASTQAPARRPVAIALAVLLVLADLLLFEFFILLAHEAVGTEFLEQRAVLVQYGPANLLALAGALGFGCRLALPALPLLLGWRSQAAHLGLLLGMLAYAFAAGVSAPLRLYAQTTEVAVPLSYWLSTLGGALLALALALVLGRWGGRLLAFGARGSVILERARERLRSTLAGALRRALAGTPRLARAEQHIGRWQIALGLLLVVTLLLGSNRLG